MLDYKQSHDGLERSLRGFQGSSNPTGTLAPHHRHSHIKREDEQKRLDEDRVVLPWDRGLLRIAGCVLQIRAPPGMYP